MDSESNQNNLSPVENVTTSDAATTNDEHKQQQSTEASESSNDQSNIVDLIGNGQLVKKVREYSNLFHFI